MQCMTNGATVESSVIQHSWFVSRASASPRHLPRCTPPHHLCVRPASPLTPCSFLHLSPRPLHGLSPTPPLRWFLGEPTRQLGIPALTRLGTESRHLALRRALPPRAAGRRLPALRPRFLRP